MTAIDKKHLILLRVFLVGAAIAWGVSVSTCCSVPA